MDINLYVKSSYFLLIFTFIFFLSNPGHAQQTRDISGYVYEGETKDIIIGANIYIKQSDGTLLGTQSNEDGYFSLSVSEDVKKFNVSYLGYTTQEIEIEGRTYFEIVLQSGLQLKEVVVTALGMERNSRNLGYAVQKIEAKEISDVKSVNFIDNLAGRVAGVNVSQGSSGVGSTSLITIRGESSFTNNNPLFVLDGIPINNNTTVNITDDSANGFMEVDFGNGAMEINADDIQSVTVLKGPSAAALYGSRAANGVILITSKAGLESSGLGISFNSSTFFEQPFRLPQFQNIYGTGNSGQFEYVDGLGGGVNDNINYSYGPRLDAGLLIPQFNSPVTLNNGQIVRGADTQAHGGLPITPTVVSLYPTESFK